MPNNLIYVIEEGAHDYSRWLNISLRPGGTVVLHLSDLCHPGTLSALSTVSCDLNLVQSSLAGGALQITLPNGYLLATRKDELLNVEFRSYEDAQACRVTLLAAEVEARLAALQSQTLASIA